MLSPFLLFADMAFPPGGVAVFLCGTFVAIIAVILAISFGVLYLLRRRVKKRIAQSQDAESNHSTE